MIKEFKARTALGKVALVLQILAAVALMTLLVLEFAGVMEAPLSLDMLLVGTISMLEALSQWKEQRSMATLCLVGASLALAVAALNFFF